MAQEMNVDNEVSGTVLNEYSIIHCLRTILQQDGSHSLSQLVINLYKCDSRIKVFIQNTLKTTVKIFLIDHPEIFTIDDESSTVSLADDLPIFSSKELSKHCSKDDAWIAVDGLVYDITEFVRTHWGWTSAGT